MNKKRYMTLEVYELREKLGLDQREFWEPVGVTQSGGSRYETKRKVPVPIQLLLKLAYGKPIEAVELLTQIRRTKLPPVVSRTIAGAL